MHDLCIAGDSVLSVGVEGTVQRSELNTLKMGGDSSGLDSAPECCDTRGGLEVGAAGPRDVDYLKVLLAMYSKYP